MIGVIVGFIVETLVFGALIVILVKTHQAETKDLHLRLASKSLEDYHYWRDGHELEVEHNRQVLEASRKDKKDETKTITAEEFERLRRVKEF